MANEILDNLVNDPYFGENSAASVLRDKSTGDVFLRLFLISNEYINKQGWITSKENYDKNVQRSLAHDLILFPREYKGKMVFDHSPFNTASASDTDKSLQFQRNYSMGRAVANTKVGDFVYHSTYKLTDPTFRQFIIDNSDDQGNLINGVEIKTSPLIIYDKKDTNNYSDWIVAHNAIVSKAAFKDNDANYSKSCNGGFDSTCAHIAASNFSECMISDKESKIYEIGDKKPFKDILKEVFVNNNNSFQVVDKAQSSDMATTTSQKNTELFDTLLVNNSDAIEITDQQLDNLAKDHGIPRELVTKFIDYKEKYFQEKAKREQEQEQEQQNKKQQQESDNKPQNNDKGNKPEKDTDNNKESQSQEESQTVKDLQAKIAKMERINAVQKLLPTQIFDKQEDYDKAVEKYVSKPYSLDELKDLIDVQVDKYELSQSQANKQNTSNPDVGPQNPAAANDNPQSNHMIASYLLDKDFSQAGSAKASDNDNDDNKAKSIDNIPHLRGIKTLLISEEFRNIL